VPGKPRQPGIGVVIVMFDISLELHLRPLGQIVGELLPRYLVSVKRDLVSVKRDLLQCQKRPRTDRWRAASKVPVMLFSLELL
jgi:hypothetical protein